MPGNPRVLPIGMRFGKLVVGDTVRARNPKEIVRYWLFCDCGGERLGTYFQLIRKKELTHCGCERNAPSRKHNFWTKRAYIGMMQRCSPNNIRYRPAYAERGIKVCQRWKDSFTHFYDDMGPHPGKGWTLDRINVNGDYCPNNCRWATHLTQQNNKRNTAYLTVNGDKKSLREWATISNLRLETIRKRMEDGATPEQCLMQEHDFRWSRAKMRRITLIEVDGVKYPLLYLAEMWDISINSLKHAKYRYDDATIVRKALIDKVFKAKFKRPTYHTERRVKKRETPI